MYKIVGRFDFHVRFSPNSSPSKILIMLNQNSTHEKGVDVSRLLRGVRISKIKFSYYPKTNPNLLPKITCSSDAYSIFNKSWDPKKLEFVEQFKVMLLSRSNRVIGILNVSTGGTAKTIADQNLYLHKSSHQMLVQLLLLTIIHLGISSPAKRTWV